MHSRDDIVEAIRRLSLEDPLAGRLTLAAYVQSVVEPAGYKTAIVGGTAVDTYVSGALGTSESMPPGWEQSLDIDTVVIKTRGPGSVGEARNVLVKAGFRKGPGSVKSLRLDDVVFPVDLVGDALPDDYSDDHVVTVHLELSQELGLRGPRLAGPEDILFDYMESGFDTRHQRDWARALAIAAVMGDHLDLGYLFTKAQWRMDGAFVEPLERLLRGEPLRV